MSRSGYSDDIDDNWQLVRWRGAVRSAIHGQRGQAFLRDLLGALHELPQKRLITGNMTKGGECCSIGALGKKRGVDMKPIDEMIDEDSYDEQIGEEVAATFGIADALAREIMWANDEGGIWNETDEQRYERMIRWVQNRIKEPCCRNRT